MALNVNFCRRCVKLTTSWCWHVNDRCTRVGMGVQAPNGLGWEDFDVPGDDGSKRNQYGRFPSFTQINGEEYEAWVEANPAGESYGGVPALTMPILWAGRQFVLKNPCLAKAMPLFHKHTPTLPEVVMSAPFLTIMLSKPSALLVDMLAQTRNTLALPALDPGLEQSPGVWGLRTPGFYTFALHVRHHPVGFESLSVAMTKRQHPDMMSHFWTAARARCLTAKAAAAERGEEMLVYSKAHLITLLPFS